MTSSPPAGLEGSDLSSVNTMMSAVMGMGKVAENGAGPQGLKSPAKPPGLNRIGRRNQVRTPGTGSGRVRPHALQRWMCRPYVCLPSAGARSRCTMM